MWQCNNLSGKNHTRRPLLAIFCNESLFCPCTYEIISTAGCFVVVDKNTFVSAIFATLIRGNVDLGFGFPFLVQKITGG
jgi:hypothetical protein